MTALADRRRVTMARSDAILAASGFTEEDLLGDDQLAELRTAQCRAWSSDPAAFDKALAAGPSAGRAHLAELLPFFSAARAICLPAESAAALPPVRPLSYEER